MNDETVTPAFKTRLYLDVELLQYSAPDVHNTYITADPGTRASKTGICLNNATNVPNNDLFSQRLYDKR
jgi:hypothetical protein